MSTPLEDYYLQRIAEIAAGAERRVGLLTVQRDKLLLEKSALEQEVEELQRTTAELALTKFAEAGAQAQAQETPPPAEATSPPEEPPLA